MRRQGAFLYVLAASMFVVGIWQHDWRLILASAAVCAIWPLVNLDVSGCLGCSRHRFVPGCPLHDPERRRNGEAMTANKEMGS